MFTDGPLADPAAPAARAELHWLLVEPGVWTLQDAAGRDLCTLRRVRVGTLDLPSLWRGAVDGVGLVFGAGLDDAMRRAGVLLAVGPE